MAMTALPPVLLLDLDDTIIGDSGGAEQCWKTICARYGPEVAPGPEAPERLRREIDTYRRWYWSDPERHRRGRIDLLRARQFIVDEALSRLGVASARRAYLAERIATDFTRLRDDGLDVLPGALDALETFRERGIRLGLITNGAADTQRRKIERFALAAYFGVIIVEGEFGCGKPDTRVYHHALAALDAAPTDAWMVGDNLEWEVFAPQRLGIAGVWVNAADEPLPADAPSQPHRIIRALSELN